MSAYAFPGLLPPISSSSTNDFSEGNSSTACDGGATNRSDASTRGIQNGNSFTGLLKASVDLLSVPSFAGSSRDTARAGDVVSSRTSSSDDTRLEEPGIAVREAKIDPFRLIQRVTGSGLRPSPQPRTKLRRRGSRERLGGGEPSSSPQSSPVSLKQPLSLAEDEKIASLPRIAHGSPHDDAIAFELSISFNGRKYIATRTLQCIMQLRDDLISEMRNKRQWLNIRNTATPDACMSSPSSSFDEANTSTATPVGDNIEGMTIEIEIPEIPPLGDDESNGNSGFVGRGFTMLHAMATSYVPVMERWLRNVVAVVPKDSECLTNFLWEPISNEDFPLELPSKSCNSLAGLGSIKELDYNTDESNDDDEW